MDMSTIVAAYQSARAATEIVSALGKLKIASEVLGKLTEVQQRLAEAQDGLFLAQGHLTELQARNAALVERISKMERWDQILAGYVLVTTAGSAVVYQFQGEPRHFACPNCISQMQIQILQNQRVWSGIYQCPNCKTNYPIEPQREPRRDLPDPYGGFRS